MYPPPPPRHAAVRYLMVPPNAEERIADLPPLVETDAKRHRDRIISNVQAFLRLDGASTWGDISGLGELGCEMPAGWEAHQDEKKHYAMHSLRSQGGSRVWVVPKGAILIITARPLVVTPPPA